MSDMLEEGPVAATPTPVAATPTPVATPASASGNYHQYNYTNVFVLFGMDLRLLATLWLVEWAFPFPAYSLTDFNMYEPKDPCNIHC